MVDDDGVVEENWYKEVTLETKVNYRYPEFAKEHDNPAEIERLEKILKPYETRAKKIREKKERSSAGTSLHSLKSALIKTDTR